MTVLRAQSFTNLVPKSAAVTKPAKTQVKARKLRSQSSLIRGICEAHISVISGDEMSQISKRRKVEPAVEALPNKCSDEMKAAESWASRWPLLAFAGMPLLIGGPAMAAYNPAQGEEVVKNVAGGAYLILVLLFFWRLLRKRAYTGTTQSFRSKANEAAGEEKLEEAALPMQQKEATPLAALWGATQAGVICYLLFQVCGLVDGYFDRQELPDQFTARNITVTLRTVARGLAYLLTFLFGANCVGLSGLAFQLAFFPGVDGKKEDAAEEKQP